MALNFIHLEAFFEQFTDEIEREAFFNSFFFAFRDDYLFADRLPKPDGRLVYILSLTFQRAEIAVGGPQFKDDFWQYDSVYAAFKGLKEWDITKQKEPDGWSRHYATRRYRPGGDPAKEYVKPAEEY